MNKNDIIEKLSVKTFSIIQYQDIMKSAKNVDISSDKVFQKTFNGFYKLRYAPEEWKEIYYKLFEEKKNDTSLTFKDIITELYNKTQRIEASFSSKMLATINPNMPILDSNVLKYLNLKLKNDTDKQKRLENTIAVYDEIVEWYKRDEAKECLKIFNEIMPSYKEGISDAKKIDCIIWFMGGL